MNLARIVQSKWACATLVVLGTFAATASNAFPRFAKKENQQCVYCHEKPGGDRNFRGLYYKAHALSFADFDETYESKAAGVTALSMGPDAMAKTVGYPDVTRPAALSFIVKDIDGKPVNLGRYAGKVILMVNVASKCGNTPQYASLEKLYDTYKTKGLVILGFPANDFGHQEPGTDQEIKEFCTETYKVAFPMFSKIVVKGDGQAPLYKFLTDKETDPKFSGDIEWNFAKFLINTKGEIVDRFPAKADPLKTPEVFASIKKQLDAAAAAPAVTRN